MHVPEPDRNYSRIAVVDGDVARADCVRRPAVFTGGINRGAVAEADEP